MQSKASETLREKCPNTELFLVRIFTNLDGIRTRSNSVFGHFHVVKDLTELLELFSFDQD